ncbi:unnamed protein product [Xylocopa violacea]|uniref:Uncharacterized protein n=1 Tax=Xylocopa violacea TaxID=135666 RepID=A0ABP1NBS8_XYLVO
MTLNRGGYRYKRAEKERKMEQEIRCASRNKYNKNPEQGLLRRQDQKSTVSDLVYKYLRKVAYIDSVRKQRNNACGRFRKRNARRRITYPSRRCTITDNDGGRTYISKALSFAVDSGYLIPADRTGRVLQLSPDLKLQHTSHNNDILITRKRYDVASSESSRCKRYN